MNLPLKVHGGKQAFQGKLAKWIISLMPPREKWLHYVESYFGGGAVLFNNDPTGISEVVNDINPDISNFWRVLQNPRVFGRFKRIITATPFSEPIFNDAMNRRHRFTDPVTRAINFFIRCRQSLSGRMKDFATLSKTRVRREMNEQASAWWTSIDGLEEVYHRMQPIVIVGPKPALDVIDENDGKQTLQYLDPPYLHADENGDKVRASSDIYEFEMTYEDHEALLHRLETIEGFFMLSGYHSDLYDKWALANSFTCHEFEIPNNAAGGKTKRLMTECLWTNY